MQNQILVYGDIRKKEFRKVNYLYMHKIWNLFLFLFNEKDAKGAMKLQT